MDSERAPEPLPTTHAPFGQEDPRAIFAKAVALAGATIRAVRSDQLDLPTPCSKLDVQKLINHLAGVLRRVAAAGRGEEPLTVPAAIEGVADDGLQRAWTEAAHEVQSAWTDDAALTRILEVPWGKVPGAGALIGWTNEVTLHTWDLAKATGQQPAWDSQVLEVAYDFLRQRLPVETGRAALFQQLGLPSAPFADVVGVPADAPLIDRLVAWSGRHP